MAATTGGRRGAERRKSFYFNDNTENTHSGRLSFTIVYHFRIFPSFVFRVHSSASPSRFDTGWRTACVVQPSIRNCMKCVAVATTIASSETESRCVTAFIARQIFSDGIFSHLNRNRREKNCAKLHTEITIVIQSLNGIQWIERNKQRRAGITECSATRYGLQ